MSWFYTPRQYYFSKRYSTIEYMLRYDITATTHWGNQIIYSRNNYNWLYITSKLFFSFLYYRSSNPYISKDFVRSIVLNLCVRRLCFVKVESRAPVAIDHIYDLYPRFHHWESRENCKTILLWMGLNQALQKYLLSTPLGSEHNKKHLSFTTRNKNLWWRCGEW